MIIKQGNTAAGSSPEPGMHRHVLAYSQNMMLVRHQFSKGWKGKAHSHPHEQLVYIVNGCIRFEGNGQTVDLRTGDSLIVDGDVEHQATALEDSDVLDFFVPFRRDYAQ